MFVNHSISIVNAYSPLQLFHGRELSANLFSIAVNKVLTAPQSLSDARHISKKCVVIVLLPFASKMLIIIGFIFTSPVLLGSSVPNVNGWDLLFSERYFLRDNLMFH